MLLISLILLIGLIREIVDGSKRTPQANKAVVFKCF